MSDFPQQVVAKLRQLNTSQQSIEGTANWCLFYNKEARTIVNIWQDEFTRMAPDRQVAQLYLANHLIQEGRKKGKEFCDEFSRVMPRAFTEALLSGDDKARKCVERLMDIWESRRVFGSATIKQLRDTVTKTKPHHHHHHAGPAAAAAGQPKQSGGPAGQQPHHHQNGGPTHSKLQQQAFGPLLEAMTDAVTCAEASLQRVSKAAQLKPRLHLEGSTEEVVGARDVVGGCVAALQAELRSRQRLITELRAALNKQEDGVRNAQAQLKQYQEQQAGLDNRKKVLDSLAAAKAHSQPPPQPPQQQPPAGAGLPAGLPQMTLPPGMGLGIGMGLPPMGLPPAGGHGFPLPTGAGPGAPGLPMPLGMPALPTPDAMLAALGMQSEQLAAMMAAQQQAAQQAPLPHQLLMPQPPGATHAPGAPPPAGRPHAQPGNPGPSQPASSQQHQQQQQAGDHARPQGATTTAAAAATGSNPALAEGALSAELAASAATQLVADHQAAVLLAQALAAMPQEERQRLVLNAAGTTAPADQQGSGGAADNAASTAAGASGSTAPSTALAPVGPTQLQAQPGLGQASLDDLMQDADFSRFILGVGEQQQHQQQPQALQAEPAGAGMDDDYDPDNPF